MESTAPPWTRAGLSDRLLRFAADRALETRDMERRVAALNPNAAGHEGMRAALTAAKAWEATILWVAWRLRPAASLSRADQQRRRG